MPMLTPRECGIRCRIAFAENYKFQYGSYRFGNSKSKILFKEEIIYSVYSDFHPKPSQWWYGIPKVEWDDWSNQSLVILMKDGNEVNYALLKPNEAIELFKRCKAVSRDEKKINIRMPTDAGKIYIIEWDQFPIASILQPLKVLFN